MRRHHLPFHFKFMGLPLKQHLQRKLNLPRRKGAADGSKCRIGDVGIRNAQVGVIQGVEVLRPELEPQVFADAEELVHAEVPLPKVGAAERVAADIAEGVAGRGSREGIKTVVMVDLVMDSAGVGDHIGAHDSLAAIIGDAARDVVRRRGCVGHIQRGSGIGGIDGVDLPAPENPINHGIPRRAELPPLAERQFINKARSVDELRIQAGGTALVGQVVNVLHVGRVVAGTVFQGLL